MINSVRFCFYLSIDLKNIGQKDEYFHKKIQ